MLRSFTLSALLLAAFGCQTTETRPIRPAAAGAAVDAGLAWLAGHQDDDGRWDSDGFMKHDTVGEPADGAGNPVQDVGITGLALLAFLGSGNTHTTGPHRATVAKAIAWLKSQQGEDGVIGTKASHDFIYSHAIAAYAMCEAYGLSGDATLKPVAQGSIDYLEKHRNPNQCWRYMPRGGDNDASVTAWCTMAYAAARDFKLEVNTEALATAAQYLESLTDPATGRTGYTKRGEMSSRHPGDHATRYPPQNNETITAVALFARYIAGHTPEEFPSMRASADLLMKSAPRADGQSIDHYGWYFGTYAMYQAGGEHWKAWLSRLERAVLQTQRADGNFKGSWDPAGVWGEDGGRVYSTALMTLTLQAYYRYARLVR